MPLHPVLVEACVTSPAEALSCFAWGARRAELCRSLDVGGLTPSRQAIAATLAARTHPVAALVRENPNTFRLSPRETDGLVRNVARTAALGVDGVVVGVLDRWGRIDRVALGELVQAAGGLPVTFHRAFDAVAEPLREAEALAEAGVARVLTSGGAPTAWQGRAVLRALVALSAGSFTVLGGGGIRGDHVRALVEETGLTEVHARASAIAGITQALEKAV